MDVEQFSEELIKLLAKLKRGHNWSKQEVLVLRAPEQLVFTEAAEEKSKVQREGFAELIKGKD